MINVTDLGGHLAALELKVPPVALLLIALFGVYFSPSIMPFITSVHALPELRANIAWSLSIVGILVAIAGVVTFKLAKTTTNPMSIGNVSSLVTHGVYRFTRNPMYLGMLLIILSFIVKTGHVAGIVFALAFVAYMTRFQIKPEERILTKIFKEQYRDYMKRTRPWV